MGKNAVMKMLILYCLQKLDGQRTIYAMLHLFNGKKSSQTIQDAHLFHLTEIFGIFPTVTRLEIDKFVGDLIREKLVTKMDEQKYCLTKTGNDCLANYIKTNPLPKHLNGWKYHYLTHIFWERLSLVVQVTSHLSHQDSKYIPIQRKKEFHQWLKGYLIKTQLNRKELSTILYNELVECFEANKEINPAFIVMRLTGYQKIGLTAEQIADLFKMDFYTYQLHFFNILHYMLECVQEKQINYPLLFLLIADQITSNPLTDSTKKTFVLLEKGLSINEIAQIRKLKQSTIEDHIVEIALNIVGFDTSPFMNRELHDLIIKAARKTSSKQLKQIRELVPEADYFQIRLVLAQGW